MTRPDIRQLKAAQREAVERLLAKISETAPPWAGRPPWEVEDLMERGIERQRRLFDTEGTDTR